MANSIALNSEMTKVLFTSSSGTTEIDLSGNGALLRIAGGDIGVDSASTPLSGSGVVESTVNAQWTLLYNDTIKKVFFIGIVEIDSGITVNEHHFDMEGKKVNIRLIGTSLVLVSD